MDMGLSMAESGNAITRLRCRLMPCAIYCALSCLERQGISIGPPALGTHALHVVQPLIRSQRAACGPVWRRAISTQAAAEKKGRRMPEKQLHG
jgi:hypothetical protein